MSLAWLASLNSLTSPTSPYSTAQVTIPPHTSDNMTDKPENETETPPKEVWHPHYDDPEHKLVLKSTDDVLFRVSAHHLGRASPVLAEMFDLALEAAEPVDMLVSTKVLCEFILCSTWPYDDKPLHLLDLTLSDTFDLYHLATRFEVPLAIPQVLSCTDYRLTGLRDEDRGYVFPSETCEKPEHHASTVKGIENDATVPMKQQDATHISTSNGKIASVSASKSGDSGITPDQHSTQQTPSARTFDQTLKLSAPEDPSPGPSGHQDRPSQVVEQMSMSLDIPAQPNKRKNYIEGSRRIKAQRTSSDIDPQVT